MRRIKKARRKANSTLIRINQDDKRKLEQIRRDLQATQGKDIRTPEMMRRIANIPRLKDVLLDDAKFKRRIGI